MSIRNHESITRFFTCWKLCALKSVIIGTFTQQFLLRILFLACWISCTTHVMWLLSSELLSILGFFCSCAHIIQRFSDINWTNMSAHFMQNVGSDCKFGKPSACFTDPPPNTHRPSQALFLRPQVENGNFSSNVFLLLLRSCNLLSKWASALSGMYIVLQNKDNMSSKTIRNFLKPRSAKSSLVTETVFVLKEAVTTHVKVGSYFLKVGVALYLLR